MPQESSPHGGSSRLQGRIQGRKDGWRAAGLHLDNFRAAQLGFVLPLVLPAADRNSSSGNLILCGASGLVGWDLDGSFSRMP